MLFYTYVLCLVAQSCPILCDSMDCSLPGSSVHGILQARILEGLPCPPPGNLTKPGIEPRSPTLQADCLPSEPPQWQKEKQRKQAMQDTKSYKFTAKRWFY